MTRPDVAPTAVLRESRRIAEEIMRRERLLAGRVIAPVDAVFDLLEESGVALRRQADALEAAAHALAETAALMQGQAELFERTIHAVRGPAELAKKVAGVDRHPRGP
jgi:hypothetical protein